MNSSTNSTNLRDLVPTFVCVVILLALSTASTADVTGKQTTSTSSQKEKNAPSAPTPQAVPTVQSVSHPRDLKPDRSLTEFFPPESWPNWLLTIVGAATAYYGLRTLRAIERQTGANEISALAAKKSADALLNIERPWLLIATSDRSMEHVPRPDGSSDPFLSAYFTFKNYGQTPALVDKIMVTVAVLERLENLPETPEYGEPYRDPGMLVMHPGEESKSVVAILRDPNREPNLPSNKQMERTNQLFDNVFKGKAFLVLYGNIAYFDTFEDRQSRPHESRFCYYYNPRTDGFQTLNTRPLYSQYT